MSLDLAVHKFGPSQMSRPQVTITLGRSGQKVVKRSSASQGKGFNQKTLSRGKRSLGETYTNDSEHPSKSRRKRVRGDKDAGGSRNGRLNVSSVKDARIGKNDLRLKLTHRRRQREILLQIEEREKEQRKRMTRSVQPAEQSHRRLVTSSQPSSGASELLQIEAMRSSYTSQTAGDVRLRSPYRLANDSKEVSSSSEFQFAAAEAPQSNFFCRSDLIRKFFCSDSDRKEKWLVLSPARRFSLLSSPTPFLLLLAGVDMRRHHKAQSPV